MAPKTLGRPASGASQQKLSNGIVRMLEEYAPRDIAEGEELLCDYDLFANDYDATDNRCLVSLLRGISRFFGDCGP
jgi:hypothetical protein